MKNLFFLWLIWLPFITTGTIPHKDQSVLATGSWFRFAVIHTGIHAITYSNLLQMGIQPQQIDPAHIRIYGNGGGMLPETTTSPRVDDLRENTLEIIGGDDGAFDPGDLVLFYGEAPDKWYLETSGNRFYHTKNLYSDSTYYFITTDLGPGKRITSRPSDTLQPSSFVYRFNDYYFHELDSLNLIRSGKTWFGEVFDNTRNERTFHVHFPNIDSTSDVYLKTYVAAKSQVISYFAIIINGQKIDSIRLDSTDPDSYYDYAKGKLKHTSIPNLHSQFDLSLKYMMPTENSTAWLNYFELNCRRNLKWIPPQLSFRDANSVVQGGVSEFTVQGAHDGLTIWEVTDPGNIKKQEYLLNGSILKFTLRADSLREYIVFDKSMYYEIYPSCPVENQNLHAIQPYTLVIVTHPLFESMAKQLASFHEENNGISAIVVSTLQVYNEFASGQKDPTAIRDFVKMLYDRGNGDQRTRYLLLFGDGSYDPKDRIPNNNNLIPTFQSTESLKFTASYVTDDYFGITGDGEGGESNGNIDIGVGRLPVTTPDEANIMIGKIVTYASMNDSTHADWRNIVTLIADDENDNLHLQQAEQLASIIATKYPEFNVNKIYLDAYQMEKIPAGMRFPEVNREINSVMQKGTLIMNYTGHGSEAGWSWEQVLTVSDIEQWHNTPKLPVFITATCEFSRFDNPERYTAGEMVILHPNGGAIALYSTTRLAMATTNFRLDSSFFCHLKDKENGIYVTMGDLIRISKNNNGNNPSIRNFALLGDPAQKIAFPDYSVKTLSINDEGINQPDTARGLSLVTVTGQVEDINGQKVTGFNGILTTKVFDKPVTYRTLGNTYDSYPQDFICQNRLLHHGKSTINNGSFAFSFIVAKSIALQYGKGKISYYATDNTIDAGGYTDQIIIGGLDPAINPVNPGPEIELYLNTRYFTSGTTTGPDPLLIADLYDTNGINFLGLGIGHDMIMVLDGDDSHSWLMNDQFIPEYDNFTSGSLQYPLTDLKEGKHTLSLKAWDMYDNSSQAEISFWIVSDTHLDVEHVMNRPNPLINYTYFIFEPMQLTGGLDVLIQIFDVTGKPVKTIDAYFPEGLNPGPLYWDGTGNSGQKLGSGIYPYRVVFKGNNGATSQTTQKLIIMR
jgi:hypothetical protein